ncbi:DUF3592 domain-containing protein [Thalassomonas sp. M1454]|uniref:DUF3592 domain-containing protein n=1 Tax=Thalassomonas sp. M1454 TaxID=2594477 RepID=UPI00117CA528|nr:DUF3592 domain-containing protein [Thalassomonas sp. M1454]TRX56833.1 DUF3592 domain-containing protein [Thalassomonas sp. M1454]
MENLSNGMLLIFGLFVLSILIEFFLMYKNQVAKGWAQTQGKLISSDVGITHGGTSGLAAKVNYQYTVNGKEFKSTQIAYATLGSLFAIFKSFYIKADKLTVFYNPIKPEVAVIVPGIRLFHILDICIVIGIMFYLFGDFVL